MREGDLLPDRQLRGIVGDAPRDVMHRTNAPLSAWDIGQLADLEMGARPAASDPVAMPAVILAEVHEAQRLDEELLRETKVSLIETDRVQSHDLAVRWDGAF